MRSGIGPGINKKGFTLVEILVVITIIGILSAIAVPSYIYAVEQGKRDACAANVQILVTQVERYRLATGEQLVLAYDQSLVQFLTDIGYLSGQQITCPFSTSAIKYEYRLTYENGRPQVTCTHPGGK